jgi:uncharacterized protein YsxB (DUF464 family)
VVEVIVRRDSRGRLSSLFASGHAGWEDAGKDVVCAAVSALVQAAWLGLEQVADVRVSAEKASGTLSLRWPDAARDDPAAAAIVATAELAIEHLASQFPNHVSIARESEAPTP